MEGLEEVVLNSNQFLWMVEDSIQFYLVEVNSIQFYSVEGNSTHSSYQMIQKVDLNYCLQPDGTVFDASLTNLYSCRIFYKGHTWPLPKYVQLSDGGITFVCLCKFSGIDGM